MPFNDWILVLIAIFVPPVAVWLKRGFWSRDFLINVLLFLFGFFPGLIHALYVISCHPSQVATTIDSSNDEESLLGRNQRYGSV